MIEASGEQHPLELLAADFVERYRQGERPSITEYTARHPDLADKIRSLFPTALLMEDLKRGRVHAGAGDFPPACRRPDRLGDCRIVREVGRGGMGVVYEAMQESLGRRVAVKVLTAQALHEAGPLHRLYREAQAMARLHHTNIVSLFGVSGHEGLPYFVMQFVEGRGLDQVVQEERERTAAGAGAGSSRTLTPSRVAQIGLQAALAIDHAHAQGILHRDLKPSNLMLDDRGTVFVTDFGLARLVEQDGATPPSEMAGTLRYMAPERFQGRSDVRTDVYSLGLTLYELLTLRPAFDETDRARLIRQATQEEPAAPRKIDPQIPRDLETVVLRAVARDPAHRYPSAGDLAEDLRRFLEDKPVRARRVGPAERLWRWCRRNPTTAALTAVAAGLLVLAAALGSVGYVQTREALLREAALRGEAEQQHRSAEASLALALAVLEEIFAQTTRTAVSPPHPAGDDEDPPTGTPVVSPEIAAMLNHLLRFYDEFGERHRSDPRLRLEIGKAYRRVGDIQQRLGQYDKAETAYRRTLALYERHAAAPEGGCEVARVYNELGLVLQALGRNSDAEWAHRQALLLLRTAVAQPGAGPQAQFELARAHTLLGSTLAKTGRSHRVEENHRSALDILARLLEEDPASAEYQLAQARCYRSLHFALAMKGRRQEGFDGLSRAASLLEDLACAYPLVPDYRYELCDVLIWLPAQGWGPERDQRLEQQFARAIELARGLTASFPVVPQYQALLARTLQKQGFVLQMAGRPGEAEKLYQEAVSLDRSLVERFPAVPVYQLHRAEACESLGAVYLRGGRLAEAGSLLEEAVGSQQAFVKANPRNFYARGQLSRTYRTWAEILRRQGDKARAQEVFRRADEVMKGR